jgi:hypothetical protein
VEAAGRQSVQTGKPVHEKTGLTDLYMTPADGLGAKVGRLAGADVGEAFAVSGPAAPEPRRSIWGVPVATGTSFV